VGGGLFCLWGVGSKTKSPVRTVNNGVGRNGKGHLPSNWETARETRTDAGQMRSQRQTVRSTAC